MLKIDFYFLTKYGLFSDALYVPEGHSFSSAEIELMQRERLNNWLYAVENPATPSEPQPDQEQQQNG
jgi:hypothetical protein